MTAHNVTKPYATRHDDVTRPIVRVRERKPWGAGRGNLGVACSRCPAEVNCMERVSQRVGLWVACEYPSWSDILRLRHGVSDRRGLALVDAGYRALLAKAVERVDKRRGRG